MARSRMTVGAERGCGGQRRQPGKSRLATVLAFVGGCLLTAPAPASEALFGGSARLFLFTVVEEIEARRDVELGAVRLVHERTFEAGARSPLELSLEVHGLLAAISPPGSGAPGSGAAGAVGDRLGHRRLDLSTSLGGRGLEREGIALGASIDRLNLRLDHPRFRLTVGRQPITWGVNYFWPALDLFGPFAPAAVDRDYKPGVDAVRLVLPVGALSEVELIAAPQGAAACPSTCSADEGEGAWSWGGLGRFHLGGADLGVLGGRFHGDTVLGGFVTGDARGYGLRGEAVHTEPGDDAPGFWRATLGIDRLLTPRLSLTFEQSYSGFGARGVAGYARLAASDRLQRGEIVSLGREYSGLSLGLQATPLLGLSAALLHNWSDGSTLLQPALSWSLSDEATALAGVFAGSGDPGSEYGSLPLTVWVAVKSYF